MLVLVFDDSALFWLLDKWLAIIQFNVSYEFFIVSFPPPVLILTKKNHILDLLNCGCNCVYNNVFFCFNPPSCTYLADSVCFFTSKKKKKKKKKKILVV